MLGEGPLSVEPRDVYRLVAEHQRTHHSFAVTQRFGEPLSVGAQLVGCHGPTSRSGSTNVAYGQIATVTTALIALSPRR